MASTRDRKRKAIEIMWVSANALLLCRSNILLGATIGTNHNREVSLQHSGIPWGSVAGGCYLPMENKIQEV